MHQFDHLVIAIILAEITTELLFPRFFWGTEVENVTIEFFGNGVLRVVMTLLVILIPLVIIRTFLYGL